MDMLENAKRDEELDVLRDKHFCYEGGRGCMMFKGYIMANTYEKIRKKVEDMEVYDDDVWVTSYPKCGTTWTQEMVWCISNNVDFEAAKEDLDYRFPFLEFCSLFEMDHLEHNVDYIWRSLEFIDNMPRPRFIKSHLPWELLPKKIRTGERTPKIIHVARNPMDTCVSYFHHSVYFRAFTGDFNLFCELFMKAKLNWGPYTSNLLGYWKKRHNSNLLFIKFEDMKSNLSAVIRVVSEFLGVKLSDEQVSQLLHHLSFDVMKKNPAVQHKHFADFLRVNNLVSDNQGVFMRSGKSGGYKSLMSPEQVVTIQKEILSEFEKEGLAF